MRERQFFLGMILDLNCNGLLRKAVRSVYKSESRVWDSRGSAAVCAEAWKSLQLCVRTPITECGGQIWMYWCEVEIKISSF